MFIEIQDSVINFNLVKAFCLHEQTNNTNGYRDFIRISFGGHTDYIEFCFGSPELAKAEYNRILAFTKTNQ